jgi:hypothetical protein
MTSTTYQVVRPTLLARLLGRRPAVQRVAREDFIAARVHTTARGGRTADDVIRAVDQWATDQAELTARIKAQTEQLRTPQP